MVDEAFSQKFVRKSIAQATEPENSSVSSPSGLNEFARQVAEQLATNTISPFVLSGFVRILDFLGFAAIGIAIFLAFHWPQNSVLSFQAVWPFIGAIVTVGILQGMDGYLISSLKRLGRSFTKAIMAIALAAMFIVATLYISRVDQTLMTIPLLSWFAIGALYLGLVRAGTAAAIAKFSSEGRLERRAVIVGGGERADEVIRSLESNTHSDITICGIFDDRGDKRSPSNVAGYPKLGTITELVEFARTARIDMFIVTLPLTAEKRLLQLLKRLWVLPVDIRLSAHSEKLKFRQRCTPNEGSVPMLDVFHRPIADWDSVTKRVFDICFASLAIVILSPVMLLAAIAVKLDSHGPIIFRQKRGGFNNEEIEVYKFRSLYADRGDKSGIDVVTRNDDRVTLVGRFIRKTSIDELPQLFNVLQGSLSLVGPRPHVPNAKTGDRLWAEVVDSYIARHKVKPGVTGWAQVTGWRGEIDNEDKLKGRVDADLHYIENWSLAFDLYILAITPFCLINTENAY